MRILLLLLAVLPVSHADESPTPAAGAPHLDLQAYFDGLAYGQAGAEESEISDAYLTWNLLRQHPDARAAIEPALAMRIQTALLVLGSAIRSDAARHDWPFVHLYLSHFGS